MKNKSLIFVFLIFFVNGCVGTSSQGIFGTGVSIAIDPRSLGTQIDDNIMQKNLAARLLLEDKKYIISVTTKVLDGRIFITGKVDDPEEKLKITKMAWETKGARSVKNNIAVKHEFSFKNFAVPDTVPPVPTPAIKCVIFPLVCFQISGPVVS